MTIRALIVATRRRSPGLAVAEAMAVAAVTGAITSGTAPAVAARTGPAAAAAAPRAMKSACPPPGPGYIRPDHRPAGPTRNLEPANPARSTGLHACPHTKIPATKINRPLGDLPMYYLRNRV